MHAHTFCFLHYGGAASADGTDTCILTSYRTGCDSWGIQNPG